MLALWDAFKREGIRVPYPVREIRVRGGALPVEQVVRGFRGPIGESASADSDDMLYHKTERRSDSRFDAFSRREPVATSLENALDASLFKGLQPLNLGLR